MTVVVILPQLYKSNIQGYSVFTVPKVAEIEPIVDTGTLYTVQ